MPWCRPLGVLLGLFAVAGCAARGNLDALESELRQQEDLRVALEDRLARTETDLRVAQSDADNLRSQLAKSGRQTLPLEQSQALHRASKLTLHSLMTGGWDNDPAPGDEGLTVLLTPVDEHGDQVKLGGDLELELLDLSLAGEQQRLGSWSIPRDEVAGLWHKGLLGAGFLVRVPWQSIPEHERLTVVARLKTADGRKFDATHQVVITPPTGPLADKRREPVPVQYKLRVESVSLPNPMAPLNEDEFPEDSPQETDSSVERDENDPSDEDQPVPPPVEPGEAVPAPAGSARSATDSAPQRAPLTKAPVGKSANRGGRDNPADAPRKVRPPAGVKPPDSPPAAPADDEILESDTYLRDNPKVRR